MRRTTILAIAVLAALLVASGAMAATLTSKNSVSYKLYTASDETISGAGCGTSASFTKTLPTGSTGVTVVDPKVGARDKQSRTQVTAVSVLGTVITVTALADGPSICDPAQSGAAPGEAVSWNAEYKFEANYSRRIQTTIRIFYESYTIGAKFKIRPKTLYDSRAGTPKDQRTKVTGIKWKSFGGKKAVGFGRIHLDWCPKGGKCPGDGGRVKLVATKAGYCKDTNEFEYKNLNFYYLGRLQTGMPLRCSP